MQRSSSVNSYDQVPYPSHPFPQTHPRRLETIAWLLSVASPPSSRCRVLELGCGDGGNLIPMALVSPECQFIGIDSSALQIEMGRKKIDALRLKNIRLEHCSIEQYSSVQDCFDYIICHGVFSWVPSKVQLAILQLIREMLAVNGVAYVSYNTQPGWHGRGAIRNMMTFHVQRYANASATEQIGRAKSLLDFLTRATSNKQDSFGFLLRENLGLLNQLPDAYLFHEFLEEHNEPIWFLDFCELLTRAGLRYLGEADFSSMFDPVGLNNELREELQQLAPRLLEKEQYMDFLRNRSFRQTLICHADQCPTYSVDAKQIYHLHVGSAMIPASNHVELTEGAEEQFRLNAEVSLRTQLSLFKAALARMHRAWPRLLPFSELLDDSNQLLKDAGLKEDRKSSEILLSRYILNAYTSSSQPIIELTRSPPQLCCELSNKPKGSTLAQLQLQNGSVVSNLRQESVRLDDRESFVLSQCNGHQTVDEIQEQYALNFSDASSDSKSALQAHLLRLMRKALLMQETG